MMIPSVNLNMVIDKELELERQGLRRTRRWIGDSNRVVDEKVYQANISRSAEFKSDAENGSRMAENKLRQEAPSSLMSRLSNLLRTRRQPLSSNG